MYFADFSEDSLVSSHVYEIIRTIYTTPNPDTSDAGRVSVLQQTLSQLRLTNIATLDACMNHFTRLIELTSADEEYISALATTLAPCVLRPRVETSLTMEEKHAYRLLRDLFAHKTAIFSELKRMSTLGHSTSVTNSNSDSTNRPRAISTDESNRRIHQEERQRALLEKAGGGRSRATSPAPSPRGFGSHRRDRSVGRFPVQTSPTEKNERVRMSMGPVLGVKRSSLEVPGEGGTPPSSTTTESVTNGSDSTSVESPTSVRGRSETLRSNDSLEKRNSLGRNPARSSLGRRIPVNPTPLTEAGGDEHTRGVTLEDKPMDD